MTPTYTLNQRGFSLVELMVVIAVIALLSAVALPIFGDYLTRARASELQSAAASAKLAMAEWAMLNSTAKEWPATNSEIGANAFGFTSDHVKSVAYKRSSKKEIAAIVVTGEDTVEGVVMYLEGLLASGRITWQCTAESSHRQWLPSTCKKDPAGGLVTKQTGDGSTSP
ncbi:MAG: pilin [Gammaproteobacteria bacterium AqS3]|nr:pilin [Gammaproteobacteria bacterium AqS3]